MSVKHDAQDSSEASGGKVSQGKGHLSCEHIVPSSRLPFAATAYQPEAEKDRSAIRLGRQKAGETARQGHGACGGVQA